MIKHFPCRVTEYSIAKPGKHGTPKATIFGEDIFTKKKYEDTFPASATVQIPIVTTTEYIVDEIHKDGSIDARTFDSEPKDDLKVPTLIILYE